MLRSVLIIVIFFVCGLRVFAQDSGALKTSGTDSFKSFVQDLTRKDTLSQAWPTSALKDSLGLQIHTDSLRSNTVKDSLLGVNSKKNSIAKTLKKQIKQPGIPAFNRNAGETDLIFYVLIFITFFLALVRKSFPKYFNSIFSLTFQATFRQTQTREQMSQNFFPAFMLNVMFILSGGLFITLFAQYYKFTAIPFWQLFIYSTTILGIIYTIKYFVIFFTGWVFNAPDAAAEYRFIVFLINKLTGVLFLPVLFVIAYANDDVKKIAITIALCIAGLFIALRYLISLARIRRNLNLSAFHFFIYLCAIEIMPLLVIYKLLFIKTSNT